MKNHVDTPRPCPRRTMGFEEIQVEGQILQCHLHPADDGNLTAASLSNSEGEKHAGMTQANVP